MSGGALEYMMSGMDDNSTGDGHIGKLSSGRHNIYNSGFNGKLSCPECNDYGVEPDDKTINITGEIDLPTDIRFYDKYDYSASESTFIRGSFGNATKEIGSFQNVTYKIATRQVSSWYNEESWFINKDAPWNCRGGLFDRGIGAGPFNSGHGYGSSAGHFGFRLVLAF